jgi:hypothetical protein
VRDLNRNVVVALESEFVADPYAMRLAAVERVNRAQQNGFVGMEEEDERVRILGRPNLF